MKGILEDARPSAVLTTATLAAHAGPWSAELPALGGLSWIVADELGTDAASAWRPPPICGDSLAFLQYTSGSTSAPKGVMVSHGNLLHNQSQIQQAFRQTGESVIVSWLPMYHDMGLIGTLLQPLFTGARCYLMAPAAFLMRPLRWLQAISRYRATTSGGPNFAYDLCVSRISAEQRAGLDLSSWQVAFNGAEQVRSATLRRFAEAFAPCGFRPEAFHPCYGLAEATLLVSAAGARAPRSLAVDGAELERNRVAPAEGGARELASCGSPSAEQRVEIVDPETLEPCGSGKVGEIWVSGPSVAQGYWERDEATRQTFQARLAGDDARFLRTGDLGFLLDGELFVTGRIKDLVILRGRNHYPQDIELTAEASHPGLRPGCGAAFALTNEEEERLVLVCELERRTDADPAAVAEAIRRAVAQEHEVPVHEVVLIRAGTIPKTTSGKIQRGKCRGLYLAGELAVVARSANPSETMLEKIEAAGPGDLPAGVRIGDLPASERSAALEILLRRETAQLLHLPPSRVPLHEPLAGLGLDSLAALQLAGRIEEETGVSPRLDLLLSDGSLATFAAELLPRLQHAPEEADRNGAAEPMEGPLSYGQRALWFLQRLAPESAAYHIAGAARIVGGVDASALRRACQRLIDRHPALRTTFTVEEDLPRQRVAAEAAVDFTDIDGAEWRTEELARRLGDEARRPFDLTRGPLLRVTLVDRGMEDPVLLLVIHHIVSDFWSLAVLVREMGILYATERRGETPALAPPAFFPVAWARREQTLLDGPEGERLWSWWRETLAGPLPDLGLPTDRPRPAAQSFRGCLRRTRLGEALSAGIEAVGRTQGATLFATLAAAAQVLLHRFSGQDEILLGAPAVERTAATADAVGYLINPVVLRAHLGGDPPFATHLARVRRSVLGALTHRAFPFSLLAERLQPVRDPGRSPLFQAMLVLQQGSRQDDPALAAFALGEGGARLRAGDLELECLPLPEEGAQLDLTLTMARHAGGLAVSCRYASDLFDGATIERLLGHFATLLESIVSAPEQEIGALALLSAGEREQVLREWNATGSAARPGQRLHDLFLAQAARTPEAVALVARGERTTYAELARRSGSLARRLQGMGVGPEVRVGVFLERTTDLVVSLLGVLQAGGAYVPLDPAYPAARVALMLEDSGAALVLSQEGLAARLPATRAEVLLVDRQELPPGDPGAPDPGAGPDNLAYLIYTSGSTGRPKAVAIEHRSAVALAVWAREVFPPEDLAGVLAATSICFDLSVFELFVPLAWGGRVILADDALALPAVADQGVTLVNTVPSAIAELVREGRLPETVRTVVLAGEPLKGSLVRRILAAGAAQVFNLYGPSEDTTYSTLAALQEDGPERSPIGRPIAGTRAHVLDGRLEPVPVGVPAELYLGGEGLARGYLGRPEITAERFVPDPFGGAGERLYRTGDLARRLPDGSLDFLGRVDHQVKVRGFRIELGEIEAALARHPQVREAVVLADAERGRLVGCVATTAEEGGSLAGELRTFLRASLPEHMVPVAWIWLDALPLTPNGKIDRRALAARGAAAEAGVPSGAPAGPVEELLAAIWSEVLGVERIGRGDDFFELGGHSLLATRVVSRIRTVFGVDLPLRSLFQTPTVEGLARAVKGAGAATAPPILPVPRERGLPLSFAQQRLWFLHQLEPESPTYNVPAALRLTGSLDRAALAASLGEVVARHEVLRTTFGHERGEPVQRIASAAPSGEWPLPLIDLEGVPEPLRTAEVDRLIGAEALRPFDLERGPLVRAALVRHSASVQDLLLTMHHIASDGWSLGVLVREVEALYPAFASRVPSPLPPLPVQYADFAVWQQGWLTGKVLETHLAFWRGRLAGAPPALDLPTDRPRMPGSRGRGGIVGARLSDDLRSTVTDLGRRHGATSFMTLLAAWKALLARYTGQDDLVVGSPIANRNRAETEGLIGFFVNTLALRTRLADEPSFLDLLGRVREGALAAYTHQDLPFEKLVEELAPERSLDRTPLFQVMFALQNAPAAVLELPGLTLELLERKGATAKFDLTFTLAEREDGVALSLEHDRGLFDATTAVRLLEHFQGLLAEIARAPEARVSDLPLLSAAESAQILREWNDTAQPLSSLCLHDLFTAQAARTPGAVAVEIEGETLTYRDLDERSAVWAARLRELGVGPEVPVGVCLERSFDLVVALLAVLRAGGAYLPLDPEYPRERLELLLADARPAVLLTWSRLMRDLPPQPLSQGARLLCMDTEILAEVPGAAAPAAVAPGNLACILYTSGSTGRPKGVMAPHAGMVNRLLWAQRIYPLQPEDRVLQNASFSFDFALWEICAPLLAGARVVLARPGGHRESSYLADLIARRGCTVAHFVPSMLRVFLDEPGVDGCGSLRMVFSGGEALTADLRDRFRQRLPECELRNQYGPTEVSIDVTHRLCGSGEGTGAVSIGRPVDNIRLHLLDRALRPVPLGVPGEVCLGGVGVMRGYLGRPEATAERLVPDPWSGPGEAAAGERLYRTGDLARYRADGSLEILGRLDRQVKVRGFRIEPDEIEAALLAVPAVRDAAVDVRGEGDARRLVAWVVADGATAPGLRAALQERLPEPLIPAAWVFLPALPLTPNGKLDRRALADPEPASADGAPAAPRTPAEEVLAGLWADLLGYERIGIHDDFFALGGHSLLATRVVSRLAEVFGVELPLRALFEEPTVSGLAARLEQELREGRPAPPPIAPAPRDEPLPLSFAQERLWFLDRLAPGSAFYNMAAALRLDGPLDVAALRWSLGEVARRHESLRTTFAVTEGRPEQVIAPPAPVPLPVVDLSALAPEQRPLQAVVQGEVDRPFDLETGPLLRVLLLRSSAAEHLLVVVLHHIISDGWSTAALTREVTAVYQAAVSGEDAHLPELPVQYADCAVWQRGWLTGEVRRRQMGYWRERLEDAPPLDLPTDHPRPAVQSFRGGSFPFALAPELARSLSGLARQRRATLFMTLLAAFLVDLRRRTGQEDLVVGTPIAGRNHPGTEGLIGFFVNSLVLRHRVAGDATFGELLDAVRGVALDAYAHQDLPFELLVEELRPERNLAQNPLFQVMFALQNFPYERIELAGLSIAPVALETTTAKFDLGLTFTEEEGGLSVRLDFASDLFETATIRRHAGHLTALLEGIAAAPDRPVRDLPLLSRSERHQLRAEWNDAVVPAAPGVVELFEAQALRSPEARAVVLAGEEEAGLSYRELDRRADRLAGRLRALGVGPEVPVGLCVERTAELVVGVLGILKSGGAWLPLDPAHPRARLAFLLEDSAVPVLVTQPHLVESLPPHGARIVLLEGEEAAPESEARAERPAPGDLAYLIYTSGTTGRPKAVQVEHGMLAATLAATRGLFGFAAGDRMPCLALSTFDIFLFELLSPLLTGGTAVLVPLRPTLDVERLVDRLGELDCLHAVPALMRQIVDAIRRRGAAAPEVARMRRVFVGGDVVPAELLEDLRETFPAARVWVLYGPTEGTILCAAHLVPPPPEPARSLLGRPLAGAVLEVRDAEGELLPIGVPGELWIGGAGVTRGYLGRDELTAEKYVRRDGGRFYRSGDRVRLLADGTLQFLGRLDHQVKVRGFRIELGEVESALGRHPEVRDAVALVRDEASGKRLVAYVVRRLAAEIASGGAAEEAAAADAGHVAAWQALYEETYGRAAEVADASFNLEGWNSSYTGEPIPAGEMREWVDHTVERVLALEGRRILEVGCGTGLLLFRVAPRAELYRGTDFSRVALEGVRREIERIGGLPQVSLVQRLADDWSGVAPGDFDTVVLNSVAQYFPGIDYLAGVVQRAVEAVAPGGRIFLGDLRSLPLLESLHTSVELHHSPAELPVAELRRRIRRRLAGEEELLVDPGLFFALARRLPAIRQVEILLKRGRHHNELSRFRYDAVLHVGPATDGREPAAAWEPAAGLDWLDWREQGLSPAALAGRLSAERPETLALAAIPNRRLAAEAAAVALLAGLGQDVETVGELRQAVAERAETSSSIDPEELWQLGERLGYAVGLTWDPEDRHGFAAVLRRRGAGGPVPCPPVRRTDLPAHAYANDPLRHKVARRLTPELRRFLQGELPDYMVPSAFVLLDALPLTAHGKVDRAALPSPDALRPEPAGAWVAPRTPTEETVARVWAELIGLERVGAEDHFFELGGHSLLATQVVSRVRDLFAVELPVRALFEEPTVAGLAARIDRESTAAAVPAAPPLVPMPRHGDPPLSFAQQRLWFLDQLEPGSSAYNIPAAVRLAGALRVPALEASLDALIERHEALRTTFAAIDGEAVQRIAPPGRQPLLLVDLGGLPAEPRDAEARRLCAEDALRPFDLERGPLLRRALLRLGAEEHVLLLTQHHIVSDGWSVGVMLRELTALYAACLSGAPSPLRPLPVQYADFAIWQRGWLHGAALEAQLAYWRGRLAGAPPLLELPTDRPRSALPVRRGAALPVRLPAPLALDLAALGRGEGASLFIVLLAAWNTLLARCSGQTDLLVGTPIANRGRTEIEGLIGFFVNTLVLRGDLAGDPRFAELVARVRETTLEAYAHQDLPFEKLVEDLAPERSLSRLPLIQVMLALQNAPSAELRLDGMELSLLELDPGTAKLDLMLSLEISGGGLTGTAEYNPELFDAATVRRWLGHFERLLAGAAASPALRLSELPLLSPAESFQLAAEWNDLPAPPESPACLHELFERQAQRRPAAVALVCGEQELSYGELDRRSGQLAGRLRRLGVGPEVRVGVLLDRRPELIVALLGVLRAGGAYVPLDPAYPADRVALMLEDSGAAVVVTRADLAGRLGGVPVEVFCLGAGEPEEPAEAPRAPQAPRMDAAQLAYVIYTSGSTGRPKGVAIEHRSAVSLVRWAREVYGEEDLAGVLASTSVCFDLSVFELFVPLAWGGRVVLVDNALELAGLGEEAGVRLVNTVPSAAAELVRLGGWPATVRTVNLAGEPLRRSLVRRLQGEAGITAVYNLYGPSEDTTYSTFVRVPAADEAEPTIGRSLSGRRAFVVDRELALAPLGVAGELLLGGPGVARGYLGRPELTAERFVPDPFGGEPGARLYRTGDLARRLAGGELEFLGRIDHQIKLRGFRIELGEIEAVLGRHPGVREAVVVVREDAPGDRRLVAYLAASGAAAPADGELRQHLGAKLPEHMVPSVFVVLEALPLTPNGKVDRRALPAPAGGRSGLASGYAAPRTPVEQSLCAIWSEVLGVREVGIQDSFFELGGHSLLATRLVSRVRATLEVELPMRTLFENPSIAAVAARIERLRTRALRLGVPPLQPRPRTEPAPLSFAQQRLWFLDQLEPGSTLYNLPLAVRLQGRLDEAALVRSLGEIVRRHASLRTCFPAVDGRPVQEVSAVPPLARVDLAALPAGTRRHEVLRLVREDLSLSFDLARGPLFRPRLLRVDAQEHVLLASMHHTVGDGWSQGIFQRELAELYLAFRSGMPSPLRELPVQYADFAVWQRSWLSGEMLEAEIEHWRRRLGGMPGTLELPTDRPRPSVRSTRGAERSRQLPPQLVTALHRLARGEQATPFLALLTGFSILLARLSGQEDLGIGTPVAGRNRLELEGLIGLFVNTLVLRADLAGDPSGAEVLRRLRREFLDAHAHQDVPLEKLVEALVPERSLTRTPLFQVMCVLQNAAATQGEPLELPDLRLEALALDPGTAKFDLTLSCSEQPGGIAAFLEYSTDLFDAATVDRLAGYLETVLAALAAEPQRRFSDLPLLSAAERDEILDASRGAAVEPPEETSLHGVIAAQAARTPESIALVWEGETLTYRELDRRAGSLADRLWSLGLAPEDLVGVCLEPSPDLVVAILGVLRAGGVYLPLDPGNPRERLALLLADSGARRVVTRERHAGRLPAEAQTVLLDEGAPEAGAPAGRARRPAPPVPPERLAYVIYTSGSTGTPRGVGVSHGAAVAHFAVMRQVFAITAADRVLQFASPSFDVSLEQVLPALSAGATVVLRDAELWPPEAVLGRLADLDLTVVNFPTAYWHRWVRSCAGQAGRAPERLRLVIGGGEAMLPEVARLWPRTPAGRARLLNAYGPTEAVITASAFAVGEGDLPTAAVPIGPPLPGRASYILDRHGNLAPSGVVGELCLGGPLARGYLGRPELTAERFVPDPFGGTPGARLYRTGDLARALPGGVVEFLGRADHQVKVRGFRIELGEIEAALSRHPDVREAVVLAREDAPGDRRLVAYVVPRAGRLEASGLRIFLGETLPPYMVPSAIVHLDALPLTPNGKIDRRALPEPDREGGEGGAAAAEPRGPVEELLARLWAEVLGLPRVGVHDNFFALGGDSILSIQVVSRARQAGCHITARQMFEHQTIAELAAVAGTVAEERPEAPEPLHGEVPLTPIQHWFFEQGFAEPHHYNQSLLLAPRPDVGPGAVARAVGALLAHHDALRFRFSREGGAWTQRPAALEGPAPFSRLDLSGLAEPLAPAQLERAAEQVQGSLDLAAGPLLRAVWLDLPGGGSRLLLVIHHLVVDGVSWRILLDDLETACGRILRGETPRLAARTTSFRRWAEGLAEHAGNLPLDTEAGFWLRGEAEPVPLPVDWPEGDNTQASTRSVTVWMEAEETRRLLQRAPAAYRAQAADLLLTALARALAGPGGVPRIELEGHGREEILPGADLTRTVGWFTVLYPVRLSLPAGAGPGESLCAVKEQLRAIPGRGIGYGLLRHLHGGADVSGLLRQLPRPEVAFNYLGQIDPALSAASLFTLAEEPSGPAQSPRGERSHLLEVTALVVGGRLRVDWSYSAGLHRRSTVEAWAELYLRSLRELVEHCLSPEAGGCTPSDFPLAGVGAAELAALAGGGRNLEDLYPLSPLQEGILFHCLYAARPGVYVEQVSSRMAGDLDEAAFVEAWARTLAHHPILRTSFHWLGLDRPLQMVHERVAIEIAREDWRGLEGSVEERLAAWLRADCARGFDLATPPLMRVTLLRTGEREHRLVWTHHHLLLDGWSFTLVAADLLSCYAALAAGREPELPRRRPYRELIAWLERQDPARAEALWRRALAGWSEPTPLVVDRPRAWTAAGSGWGCRTLLLSARETASLQARARRGQVTLNTLVQGAWGLLLGRYSGHPEVVFGVTVAGRPADLPGVEAMAGLFINTLPLRLGVAGDDLLAPWLARLQRQQAELRQHEHTPLVSIQGWSEIPRGVPLFESVLVFENHPRDAALLGQGVALGLQEVESLEHPDAPLTVGAIPGESLTLRIDFDRSRFDEAPVARILQHVRTLLAGMAEDGGEPGPRLADLTLLSAAERHQVHLEWNDRAAAGALRCAHEEIEEQARRTPEAAAVLRGEERLTYAELNARANRLARRLRQLGVERETPVGVCLERSPDLVVALLAVLKAGGAFLPLDPVYPRERLAFILEDSRAPVVIAEPRLAGGLPLGEARVVSPAVEAADPGCRSAEDLPAVAGLDSLAYVIYTSGSTGRPKGVLVEHGNLASLLRATRREFGWCSGDVMPAIAPFSFDIFLFELLSPLTVGGTAILVPAEDLLEMDAMAALLEKVTRFHAVPALMRQVVDALSAGAAGQEVRGGQLRTLFTGGDLVPPSLLLDAQRVFPAAEVRVLYGPTEGTILASTHLHRSGGGAGEPVIGRPLENMMLRLYDRNRETVPIGVPGELYLGGDGVSRGYLRQEALTREKYPVIDGRRWYRTGDLARWQADGTLEFLGRVDDQVKIRGFRIEPGEIEEALRSHPAVRGAAVAAPEQAAGERWLVAYVAVRTDAGGSAEPAGVEQELRDLLARRLPSFMIPALFVFLEDLPLGPNGKIDRRALPLPTEALLARRKEFVPPRTSVEEKLAVIWAEVLGVERVGVHDDFFALGGHSLLATRVASRLWTSLGVHVTVRELYENPALEDLARVTENAMLAASDAEKLDALLALVESLDAAGVEALGPGRLPDIGGAK